MTQEEDDYQPEDFPVPDPRSLSRHSDPSTSRQAAEEVVADGTVSRMSQIALNLVRSNPGKTANELEKIGNFKEGQIRKRLSGLRAQGLIRFGPQRKSTITGKRSTTWLPNE